MTTDVRGIATLKLQNILSFGPDSEEVELGALNVIVGPNGSGKSNLLEVIGLLQGAPRELAVPVREGGGIRDWLWKGGEIAPTASIDVVTPQIENARGGLRYRLSFTEVGQRLQVTDERIENARPVHGNEKPYFYFGYERGRPMLNLAGAPRALRPEDIDPQQSVLSQRKDPEHYPEVTAVGKLFESFRLYREWSLGRYTPPRIPQAADLPNDFVSEDLKNLGLVLNRLRKNATVRRRIIENLRIFYEDAEDVDVIVEGGTVQIFLQEKKFSVPATRISDGTLRWIALLAILLHPSPPAVICLEEPELGLHPDAIAPLVKLLQEASERTQILLTTHSDVLVDALTESPASVLVCEKPAGSTQLRRLDPSSLQEWLNQYSLGQLWRRGEIGGNRW